MAIQFEVYLKSMLLLICSFVLSVIINKYIITYSNKKQCYQVIKDDIVSTHQLKKNTPSFGGVAIIVSIVGTLLIVTPTSFVNHHFNVSIIGMVLFFLIGLIDDSIKVFKKDSHGLSSKIRLLLEILISLLILFSLNLDLKANWYFHFGFQNKTIYLSLFAFLLFLFVLIGSSNGMNLTDGLDGLASTLYLLCMMPFIIISLKNAEFDLAYLLIASYGGVLGFIIYNLKPAKIFMGDSGSLALGFLLGITAIILKKEGLLIISGFVLILETLSVILQVAYFKLTKKRLFKMAPLHHHFEMKGNEESRVVMAFYVFGFICSFLALFLGF